MSTDRQPATRPLVLAGLPRHTWFDELPEVLARYREKGYTGIWIENDYVGWVEGDDPDQGYKGHFGGNWRLYNVYDFVSGPKAAQYAEYLDGLLALCEKFGLEAYMSFWLPRLTSAWYQELSRSAPRCIGRARLYKEIVPTLCTCGNGDGLRLLDATLQRFLQRFPRIAGLKVATEDCGAANCDELCPQAAGTTKAENTAAMFQAVQTALGEGVGRKQFLLYPWFWKDDFRGAILSKLRDDFLVVTKFEVGSEQLALGKAPKEPLFDCSLVAGQAGPEFLSWVGRVGAGRIVDMVPVGPGMDDFFINGAPNPARLFRRLARLRAYGVNSFLDFECGGHTCGSMEETVAVFRQAPEITEMELLETVATRIYGPVVARESAVRGWQLFDTGYGNLPIGLGQTGSRIFSGRFGFASSLCIATPLLRGVIGPDREHLIHWFSPYNFFHGGLALRLQVAFGEVLDSWEEAALLLTHAAMLVPESPLAKREAASARAHVLSVRSILNWCQAALVVSNQGTETEGLWEKIAEREIRLTEQFTELLKVHPWLWGNNCWHPHRTPLSQQGLGFLPSDRDIFTAKLRVMNRPPVSSSS